MKRTPAETGAPKEADAMIAPPGPQDSQLLQDLELLPTPLVLVSRDPTASEGERSTRAARLDTTTAAADWARRASAAGRNLYAVRNPVVGGTLYRRDANGDRRPSGSWGNPPQLEDVGAVLHIPIDIDPADHIPDGDLPTHERSRTAALHLLGALGLPLLYTMDTGRGVQACIRLAQPAPRDTDEWRSAIRMADRIEARLRQLAPAELVKVDNVSNVNRFTRLCGLVNQRTGRRAEWVTWPDLRQVVHDAALVLADQRPARVRFFDLDPSRLGDITSRHVLEALRDIDRAPNDGELDLLGGLDLLRPDQLDEDLLDLEHLWLARRPREHPDRSSRQHHFANEALRGFQPLAGVVAALTNPENAVLNEHWLRPRGRGRPDPWRLAIRCCVKAIMNLGIEVHDEQG